MSALPPRAQIQGGLVVSNWEPDGGNEDDYFLDLTTMQKEPLGPFTAYKAVASSDGTRLAYFTADFGSLALRDIVSDELVTVSLDSDYYSPVGWLDREHILIIKMRFVPLEEPFKLPSLVVLSLPAGERREFVPEDYPLLHGDYEPFFNFGYESRLVPDPTLTRLVYAGLDNGANPIILWDLMGNREITRIYTQFYRAIDYTPRWSPNAS